MKPNTDRGYITKPKPVKGYTVTYESCECGCKSGYWYYVKIKTRRMHTVKKQTLNL